MTNEKLNKKVIVVGGPIVQAIDPVLSLVPTGHGNLADAIAQQFERNFQSVERLGNYAGATAKSYEELKQRIENGLDADVVVFLAHLPNIIVKKQEGKIRLDEAEEGQIVYTKAPKLVELVKKANSKILLVPFKLVEAEAVKVDVVRWMLNLKVNLTVYSRLGDSKKYWIIDILGNEVEVMKEDLPQRLVEMVSKNILAIRRPSVQKGNDVPEVEHLEAMVNFSREMQPAFAQIIERNVESGRWPGNFSFRCTYGFLSARTESGFVITKRNVSKTGLTKNDFVWVKAELEDEQVVFSGNIGDKPSTDAPVHRIIYNALPWVKAIVHGHMHISGENVHSQDLPLWPCGSENEAQDILQVAPRERQLLWVVNVHQHGFVALIGDDDPSEALNKLREMAYFMK